MPLMKALLNMFIAAAILVGATLAVNTPLQAVEEQRACTIISKQEAEAAAVAAVPGSTVIFSQLDHWGRRPIWEVDVTRGPDQDYDVFVDGCTGKVRRVVRS